MRALGLAQRDGRPKDMAAGKGASRDAFIGWKSPARERDRRGLTNNTLLSFVAK